MGILVDVAYIVAEVTNCKQADDFRGHEEICSEPGGVMDYEEDRTRPKRYFFAVCRLYWLSCRQKIYYDEVVPLIMFLFA